VRASARVSAPALQPDSIDYSPRSPFLPFHARGERWACIVAHRRSGKSTAGINELLLRSLHNPLPAARYAFIAPYYAQAKQIAWTYLKHYAQPVTREVRESELSVELVNGAIIRLFGADNPDALRGIYLDGVILDEFADMKAGVWGEIVRPMLTDRTGFAVFIGTPRGKNHFWELWDGARGNREWYTLMLKASETGLIASPELASARVTMTEDQYDQEFECSFEAAILGAIYSAELKRLEDEEQIRAVPYDPRLPVHTAWDLGVGDSTAIWFAQHPGPEVWVIDYHEAQGEGLPHYAAVLDRKRYKYGRHLAPHDIEVRELGSGSSRFETAQSLGIYFEVVPNIALEDGIHAVRMLLPRCYFDETRCAHGLEMLRRYCWNYSPRIDEFTSRPVHNIASHAADAFRYLAVGLPARAGRNRDEDRRVQEWNKKFAQTVV
jgi:phage terminase large subunit